MIYKNNIGYFHIWINKIENNKYDWDIFINIYTQILVWATNNHKLKHIRQTEFKYLRKYLKEDDDSKVDPDEKMEQLEQNIFIFYILFQ